MYPSNSAVSVTALWSGISALGAADTVPVYFFPNTPAHSSLPGCLFFFFNCHLMLHYVCFAFQTAATMAPEKQCFASALGSFSDTDGLRVLVLSHSRSVHYKQRPDRIRRVCEVCIWFLFPHAASLSGPVFLCPVLSDSFFFFFFFRWQPTELRNKSGCVCMVDA